MTDSCQLCGSTDSQLLLSQAGDYITGDRFDVRRCGRCGVAATAPQPESLGPYYPNRYRQYNPATVALLKFFYRWRVSSWMAHLPAHGRALEIGCGHGWMLRAIKERGWQVVGTERTLEGARFAAQSNQIPMFVGSLEALKPGSFDLVVLFQVLEHMTQPREVLQQAARLLKPGGSLIVSVPNFGSWQARVFKDMWLHLDVPRHLFHFSLDSLRRALGELDLDVQRVRYESFEHDPFGWLQGFFNRIGFSQNLLTKTLQGLAGSEASAGKTAAMAALSVPLGFVSLGLSLGSWAAGSGAIMEVWSARRDSKMNSEKAT